MFDAGNRCEKIEKFKRQAKNLVGNYERAFFIFDVVKKSFL